MTTKTYLVVYMTETDGEICIRRMTVDEIKKFAETCSYSDFAVINGNLIKSFDGKLDPKRLERGS